jgi:thiol-disulfide isomerase/thioredoxin
MRPRVLRSAWLLCMGVAGVLAAEAPAPVEMLPSPIFRVEVDGTEVRTAEVFFGETGLLILGCNFKDPLLVGKQDRTVRYCPRENVVRDDEGNVTLKGTPTGPFALYQVNAGQIIFQAEGRKVRVLPKPPLLGNQTLEAIIQHNPDYEYRIETYKPNAVAVAYLSKYSRKTQLEIYFATWCPHCEAWVPRLVKSIQSAANPSISMRFTGLPRSFGGEPDAKRKQITGIPTILIIQDDKEIGRIEGPPEKGSLEEALVKILQTQTGG